MIKYHHKRSPYDFSTVLQGFWSHMIALCENTQKLKPFLLVILPSAKTHMSFMLVFSSVMVPWNMFARFVLFLKERCHMGSKEYSTYEPFVLFSPFFWELYRSHLHTVIHSICSSWILPFCSIKKNNTTILK